jgi:hypothetical protein
VIRVSADHNGSGPQRTDSDAEGTPDQTSEPSLYANALSAEEGLWARWKNPETEKSAGFPTLFPKSLSQHSVRPKRLELPTF